MWLRAIHVGGLGRGRNITVMYNKGLNIEEPVVSCLTLRTFVYLKEGGGGGR